MDDYREDEVEYTEEEEDVVVYSLMEHSKVKYLPELSLISVSSQDKPLNYKRV